MFRLTLRRFATLSHWLVLAGLLGILALLTATNSRHDLYFGWFAGYLTALVPIVAFVSAGGAMRDELKGSTIDYVFTRPIPRWAFVLFRYFAQLFCAQVDFLCAFLVIAGIGLSAGIPGLVSALPLLLLAQFLMIAAFSALGLLLAQLTSRYVVIGLLYGAIVEVGIGHIPTQLSQLSLTQQIRRMLHSVLASPAGDPLSAWAATGTVLVFVVLILGLAAALFSRRELIDKHDA